MLGDADENCYIEAPFYANRGGKHVRLGKNAYINFSFTAVDDTHINIGDHTMIAPGVRGAIPIRTRSSAQKRTSTASKRLIICPVLSHRFSLYLHISSFGNTERRKKNRFKVWFC